MVVSAVLVVLSSLWILLGAFAVAAVTRARAPRVPTSELPPVTVLKPLCGADPSLRGSLESFFRQDHPELEIVFGVEREDDPSVPIVRDLIAAYPNVAARLVAGGGGRGHNPKVRNLLGMVEHARHDLVLVSDSNVRAPAHYVSELAAIKASDPRVGVVTNLFAGSGAQTFGGQLECVQLAGFVAAGAALPTLAGDAALVGKSMLLSRTELGELGGFERVADVLAEDYVIGKMFQGSGKRVAIAPTVLANVVGPIGVATFFRRHLRWSMLRIRLRPWAFLLEPLASPLVAFPFAWLVLGRWALAWIAAAHLVRDAAGWILLRGRREMYVPLLTSALRDVVALAVWLVTPVVRHVSWRGHRVRVGAGTLLFGAVR